MSNYEIFENFDTRNISSVKIGGIIKYFYVVNNIQGIKEVFKIIKNKNYDYYVIGGCSKILFPDIFMRECLVKLNIDVLQETKKYVRVGAGTSLKKLAAFMASKGYKGFSGLISIPGSVGGAICNNAGAFGDEISTYLSYVKVFENGKIKILSRDQLDFSYRSSSFKQKKAIILEAYFAKIKGNKEEILVRAKANAEMRAKTQPINAFTLGSTFKNKDEIKIAKILDELSLKGFAQNGLKISEIHANFILNVTNSTQKNFLNILVILRTLVYNKLKYLPDLEIIILRW